MTITWLPPAPARRDPASIATVLRWVCAQHAARLDAEGLDIALDTARLLGATPREIAQAMRGDAS